MTVDPMTVDPMTEEPMTVAEEAVTKPVETAAPTEWDTWETSGTWPPYTTDLRKSELIKFHCDLFDLVCIGLYVCVTSHAHK